MPGLFGSAPLRNDHTASTSAFSTLNTHPHNSIDIPNHNHSAHNSWSFATVHDEEDPTGSSFLERASREVSAISAFSTPVHEQTPDASDPDPAQSSNTSYEDASSTKSDDEEVPTTKWDLRPRDHQNNHGHTWIDQDDSGDYDPAKKENCKAIAAPIRRKRSRSESREENDNQEEGGEDDQEEGSEDGQKKARLTSWLWERQNGASLPVALSLKSAKAKQLLATHKVTYKDNWPEHLRNTQASDGLPPPRVSPVAHDLTAARQADTYLPYNLRNRSGEADKDEDLTGHPLARGCKACRQLDQHCPLLDPGSSYPCHLCIEDGCECELNVPPTRKQPCEHCRKRRKKCSYASESDHSAPCHQCFEEGFHCVAGPAYDPSRVRIAPDGTPAVLPAMKRSRAVGAIKEEAGDPRAKFATCTACRKANKRCSLRKDRQAMPCRFCDNNGFDCALDSTCGPSTTTTASRSTGPTAKPTTSSPIATTPPIDPRLLALRTHGSAVRRRLQSDFSTTSMPLPRISSSLDQPTLEISTLLAHPVKFNCPSPTRHKPCHWHLSPAFGLTGLGPPPSATGKVTVAMLPTKMGFREISGGHASTPGTLMAGVGGAAKTVPPLSPCRMCVSCTLPRILTIACPSHHLERLRPEFDAADTEGNIREWMTAFSELERCVPGSETHDVLLGKWCSICPSLAEFGCVTPSSSLSSTSSSSSSSATTTAPSCSLRLCGPCAMLFTELCHNDLQTLVKELQRGIIAEEALRVHWPLGLRADWEFLDREGGLVRQVVG